MPKAHRETDARICGATTVVNGQSTVFVNSKLWAVLGDPNTHGDGDLINTTGNTVFINGLPVIVHGPDDAQPDDLCPLSPHCNPKTAQGSDNVYCYG
jgi:uncharacterized Zn-binding protein involved in type VI secretion